MVVPFILLLMVPCTAADDNKLPNITNQFDGLSKIQSGLWNPWNERRGQKFTGYSIINVRSEQTVLIH